MNRTIVRYFSLLIFLALFFIASANLNRQITIVAVVGSSIMLILFIFATEGIYTGFLMSRNSDKDSALQTTEDLCNLSDKSIKILAGCLNPIFFFDNKIIKALKSAIARGVSVDIIFEEPGSKINPDNIKHEEFKNLVKQNSIKLYHLKNRRPHFIVVDGSHVRLERKHKDNQTDPEKDLRVKAEILYFTNRLGKCYDRKFNLSRDKSIPLI